MKRHNILFLLALLGCGDQFEGRSTNKNIFGNDSRQLADVNQYPWSTIGKMKKSGCTASLVGPSLILTAGHCAEEFSEEFLLGYNEGSFVDSAFVLDRWKIYNDLSKKNHDWAVMIIDKPLGHEFGWLDFYSGTQSIIDSLPVLEYDAQVSMEGLIESKIGNLSIAGYPIDLYSGNVMINSSDCSVYAMEKNQKSFLHDCDTSKGYSGSAILKLNEDQSFTKNTDGRAVVVGMQVAAYMDNGEQFESYSIQNSNLAAPATEFWSVVDDLRNIEIPNQNFLSVEICNNTDSRISIKFAETGGIIDPSTLATGYFYLDLGECFSRERVGVPAYISLTQDGQRLFFGSQETTIEQKYFCVSDNQSFTTSSLFFCSMGREGFYLEAFEKIHTTTDNFFKWTIE